MVLMNRLNAKSVATLGAGKYDDGAGLLLHKRKKLENCLEFLFITSVRKYRNWNEKTEEPLFTKKHKQTANNMK